MKLPSLVFSLFLLTSCTTSSGEIARDVAERYSLTEDEVRCISVGNPQACSNNGEVSVWRCSTRSGRLFTCSWDGDTSCIEEVSR